MAAEQLVSQIKQLVAAGRYGFVRKASLVKLIKSSKPNQ